MATPNYGYEKRQRELAKKQKKEEKLRNNAERKSHGDGSPDDQDAGQKPDAGDSSDASPTSAG